MERRTFLAGTAAALAAGLAPRAYAQAPEKPKLTLGVGGKPLLYYLPLTVAERKGFFKEEGLDVEINDFGGGARSLQSLIGGSVDVVTGAYEHTIRMQAKGQDVRALVELGRFPGIVLAVKKDKAGQIKSAADLKGAKIGVTAPGSSTALAAQYAMVKAGLKAGDAALIAVGGGAGAVAAMKKGEIDAISHLDPVIAKLEADGDIQVLARHPHRVRHPRAVRRLEPGGGALHQAGLHRAQPGDRAAPDQRLREVAEMAGDGEARGRGGDRAGRVPPRRQAALRQGGAELARRLLAHRRDPAGGHGERHGDAEDSRPGARQRQGRPRDDV